MHSSRLAIQKGSWTYNTFVQLCSYLVSNTAKHNYGCLAIWKNPPSPFLMHLSGAPADYQTVSQS